jgi:hypothetical protein
MTIPSERTGIRHTNLKFRLTSCFLKRKYPTHTKANQVKKDQERNGSVELRVYHCEICDGYHLTKRKYYD